MASAFGKAVRGGAMFLGAGLLFGAYVAETRAAPSDANDFVVVDCRLPPKVRKLGTQMTYQVAGQLLKLPAKECEIRGGEYTLDDPGSYDGAIKRWTPLAQAGDPKAQANLGALYERTNPPNYTAAAGWYQKAVDQKYGPAATALGVLYELGKGVPKDAARALNLYRQASGITDKTLDFITPAQETPAAAPAATQTSASQPAASSLAPPSIEIVYPLATGDQGRLRVRASANSGTLVGRIVSQAGIQQASADNQPLKVDSEGYFTLPLAAVAQKPSLRLAASDILGRSAAVEVAVGHSGDSPREAATSSPRAGFGRYFALVIGNSRFLHWDEIDNAQNDAKAVEEVLRTRYGFETTLLINADRRDMLKAFNDMREKLSEGDNLLVYYAGHGHLVPEINRAYWIPIDADTDSDADWILSDQVTDYLGLIPARHIIIIADSCYSGALTRDAVQRPKPGIDLLSRTQAIKALSQSKVRTVMTSGGIQPVLDSGVNGHSVFANALLRILTDNHDLLEANRLFDAINPQVVEASERYHYKQTPTYRALTTAGHEGGDFLFVPVNAPG